MSWKFSDLFLLIYLVPDLVAHLRVLASLISDLLVKSRWCGVVDVVFSPSASASWCQSCFYLLSRRTLVFTKHVRRLQSFWRCQKVGSCGAWNLKLVCRRVEMSGAQASALLMVSSFFRLCLKWFKLVVPFQLVSSSLVVRFGTVRHCNSLRLAP